MVRAAWRRGRCLSVVWDRGDGEGLLLLQVCSRLRHEGGHLQGGGPQIDPGLLAVAPDVHKAAAAAERQAFPGRREVHAGQDVTLRFDLQRAEREHCLWCDGVPVS